MLWTDSNWWHCSVLILTDFLSISYLSDWERSVEISCILVYLSIPLFNLVMVLLSRLVMSNFFIPMDCRTPGFPVLHPKHVQIHVHWVGDVMPSNHLILCCPLLCLPSIFPNIRVFSNESTLCIRCPEYWSCSVSISPLQLLEH